MENSRASHPIRRFQPACVHKYRVGVLGWLSSTGKHNSRTQTWKKRKKYTDLKWFFSPRDDIFTKIVETDQEVFSMSAAPVA